MLENFSAFMSRLRRETLKAGDAAGYLTIGGQDPKQCDSKWVPLGSAEGDAIYPLMVELWR